MNAGSRHLARSLALAGALVGCAFLPFLPGRYDALAEPLSGLAQGIGLAGLLLVPLGTVWLMHEVRRVRAPRAPSRDKGFAFAVAALCATALVAAIVSLGAFAGGPTLGLVTLLLSVHGVSRLARRVGALKSAAARTFNGAPVYLVVVPLVVAGARFLFLESAVESSRNRAIQNSAPLIAEIEAYRSARGRYPPTLGALWSDYDPGVIGVRQYHYEPRGAAYCLYFEQIAAPVGTREIVMYDPLDGHAFPSHDSDLLRWSAEELAARPGHYALHDAPSPHWKCFWFD